MMWFLSRCAAAGLRAGAILIIMLIAANVQRAHSEDADNCWDGIVNFLSLLYWVSPAHLKMNVRAAYNSKKYMSGSVNAWYRYYLTNYKFDFMFRVASTASIIPFRQKGFRLYVGFEGLDKDLQRVECTQPLDSGNNTITFAQDIYFNPRPANDTDSLPYCDEMSTALPCKENCSVYVQASSAVCMERHFEPRSFTSGENVCKAMFPSTFVDFGKNENNLKQNGPGISYSPNSQIFKRTMGLRNVYSSSQQFDVMTLKTIATIYRCYEPRLMKAHIAPLISANPNTTTLRKMQRARL